MSNPLNGTRSAFVKAASVLTSVATVLSLGGFAVIAPLSANAALIANSSATPGQYGLTEGNTISAAGSSDPDVYIVNAQGYKRLFLNPVIFSFYGHLGGFAAVKKVSAQTRDAFPTSGLFRDCQVGSAKNDGKVYGVESTGEDTAVLHWVNMSGSAAVAQDSQFFNKVFCINDNEMNWYSQGSVYTDLSQVPNYTRGVGVGPTPTPSAAAGVVMASLSPDNPASGTVIATQGTADLAHFRLTNPSGSAVAVNSLSFQRLGVSGDSTFSNAYVFAMIPGTSTYGWRLTDASTPSTGVINFNGGTSSSTILTVPAGSYVDIAFRTDIAGSTSGQTVGVGLVSINGAAVSGLSGNLFQVATNPSDLATAVWATSASLVPATAGVTSDPLKDTVVWQNSITISNKNVLLRRFALRQTNSINASDVNNFRLFVDGVQVAQAQNLDANGYVTFAPASPYTVLTGSRTIKVLADIVGGTSRKLTMSLRSAADTGLADSNYNVNVTPTISSSGTFPLTAGDITINSGSIVAQKDSTSPSGNVVKSSSDLVLGRWTLTAYGEPVKVSTLIAGLRLSGGSPAYGSSTTFRNGRIMAYPVGNPSAAQQYGSTTSLANSGLAAVASTSFTTNLTVNPGTPMTVEVRADIYDNGDATDRTLATDTITATLGAGSGNAQGMVSLTSSAVPSATTAANQLTIQSGSATISAYAGFQSQTYVVPKAGAKLADFILTGSTNEAININTLTLDVTAGGTGAIGDLSNVYLKYNGVPTSVKSTISATGNTYSISNTTLPVNGSVHVEVFADLAARTGTATYLSKVEVSGTTVQSALAMNTTSAGTSTSSTGSTFSGQTITTGSGTITSQVSGQNPVSQLVASGQTVDVAKFNFLATNDNYNITEIQFHAQNNGNNASGSAGIQNVVLKKADGTVVATSPLSVSGTSQIVTFGSLNGLNVTANDANGLTLTAAVQTANVGIGAASTALNVGLNMYYYKVANGAGVISTNDTSGFAVRSGNSMYLHNAYPVVTAVALPNTTLSTGVQTVSKFTVAAGGNSNGNISIGRFLWTINRTSGTQTVSSTSWQLLEDGVDITSNGVANGDSAFASSSIGAGRTSGWIQWPKTNAVGGASERQVPVSGHTYELKGNFTAAGTTGDSFQAVLQPSSSATVSGAVANKLNIAAPTNGSGPAITWSDRVGDGNMGGTTTVRVHSTTTPDWMNDYLVKNLPISQGLFR